MNLVEENTDRVLTDAWDRSPHGITWSKDGKTLYASADDLGQAALFGIDVGTGQATRLFNQGHVTTIDASTGKLLFALDSLLSPVELVSLSADGSLMKSMKL